MHIASGDQGQGCAKLRLQRAHALQPVRVIELARQVHGQPAAPRKLGLQPQGQRMQLRIAGRTRWRRQHQAVVQRKRGHIGRCERVLPLGCNAARARDELAQVAVARQRGGQHDEHERRARRTRHRRDIACG